MTSPGTTDPSKPFIDTLDSEKYRRRNVIERCFGWLKECRRVLTRFEKLAVNYQAMVHLAMIERYLRLIRPET